MKPQTKKMIKASFIKLLRQKPLSKITVKEIVESCGINRNSFYYHYNDIPNLLEEIINEKTDEIIREGQNGDFCDWMTAAIRVALENSSAVLNIFNYADRRMFERSLNRIAERTVTGCVDFHSAVFNISDDSREAVILYYKGLLTGLALDWLGSGMKYDLEHKMKRICAIFDGTFENAMRKCKRFDKLSF